MKKKVASKENNEKRDQYTVVLEDLRSNFRAFGENLSIVRDRVHKIDERLIRMEQDIVNTRLQIAHLEERVAKTDERIARLESASGALLKEIVAVRHQQINGNELKYLEARVLRLEKARR